MHPHSTIAEALFGPKFTRRFKEIVDGRVSIKHEAWEEVNKMLDGKLAPYIQKVMDGELTSKELANALKIAINSVYGLTAANFDNALRDTRNIDNIVAKRGALFMVDLQHAVQEKGFTVAHIKTDSIKIPDATPEIIQFVMDFGKKYGYTFEHEATYDKMCLVNNAVYIARYRNPDGSIGDWTATGKQFAVPYLFKTLFSKEPIEFEDLCETMSVNTALYLDMNESLPDVSEYEKVRELRRSQKPIDQMTKKDAALYLQYENMTDEALDEEIEKGHRRHFIGKVGSFCPMKPGCGGGILEREGTDKYGNVKYTSATGSKGYRWLEAEMVKELGKEKDIDYSFYRKLVDEAIESISEYCNFDWFVSDDVPPWLMPCSEDRGTCEGCKHFHNDQFHYDCGLGYDITNAINKI